MPRLALRFKTLTGFTFVAFAIVCMVFYVGADDPLTDQEVDHYMATIHAQTRDPGGRHDLPALRRFLEQDDGKPFYTINLYAFHDEANYAQRKADGATGREAYDRFSKSMVRLLARRGSHPVFGSDWIDADGTGWDRIVIVRYRSRRDIADLFASTAFVEACDHKWAALKRNDRLLVQAVHIPEAHVPALLLGLGGLVLMVPIRRNPSEGDRTTPRPDQQTARHDATRASAKSLGG